MIKCEDIYWVENPKQLFCEFSIIPSKSKSLEQNLNALSRLIIAITIISFLSGYKRAPFIGVLSLVIITALYYTNKNKTNLQENFEICAPYKGPLKIKTPCPRGVSDPYCNTNLCTSNRFCNDCVEIIPDSRYVSSNQALVGGANPKTLIPPIVAPPIADETYWRSNEFVYPNAINDVGVTDLYASGYLTNSEGTPKTSIRVDQKYTPRYGIEKFRTSVIKRNVCGRCGWKDCNCKNPCTRCQKRKCRCRKYPGDILTTCNYDPTLLRSNLPTNRPVGKCQQNPVFDRYNDQLATQIIQPGVYAKAQVLDPINSNMGISFTQQFQPIEVQEDCSGNTIFVTKDPRLTDVTHGVPLEKISDPTRYDVYDPRGSGYGTSYRAYLDPLLGQTKFYYDDIDAVRQGNFLIRSDIDHLPSSSQGLGPMKDLEFLQANSDNSRYLAHKSFLDNSLQHRTDIQERLMRKYNNTIAYQRRTHPIRRNY